MGLEGEMIAAVGLSVLCALVSFVYFGIKRNRAARTVRTGFPVWKIVIAVAAVVMAAVLLKFMSGFFAEVESLS